MLRLKKENTIGLIIDIQEKLVPHMQNPQTLTENASKFIRGLSALEVPVVFTQQYTKGLGPTLTELSTQITDFSFFEKTSFSCCGNVEFLDYLKQSGRKSVVLAGIESHVCVMQTALDLLDNGFDVLIVADAVSSRKGIDYEVALQRLQTSGCTLGTTESVLFELTVAATDPCFKQISQIVK